jgi:predicted component of type VI protein secretion system
MANDAEPGDPLEEMLADWFAGAMLCTHARPDADEVSAYVAELDGIEDTRLRARALAHSQCLRLYARLARHVSERECLPGSPARCAPAPRARNVHRPVHFELSI